MPTDLLWMILRQIQSDAEKQDKDFGHVPIVEPAEIFPIRHTQAPVLANCLRGLFRHLCVGWPAGKVGRSAYVVSEG